MSVEHAMKSQFVFHLAARNTENLSEFSFFSLHSVKAMWKISCCLPFTSKICSTCLRNRSGLSHFLQCRIEQLEVLAQRGVRVCLTRLSESLYILRFIFIYEASVSISFADTDTVVA